MFFIFLLFQLPIEITPEQAAAARQLISNAREAASESQASPAQPPKFAPSSGSEAGGGVPPISDKSFTGGGNSSSFNDGVARAPKLPNPKRCLCGPECPYCSGDCTTCDCLFQPLPKPGPGRIRWMRIRVSREILRSRF